MSCLRNCLGASHARPRFRLPWLVCRNVSGTRTRPRDAALVTTTDVEVIFVDRVVQRLIRTYALGLGESPAWLGRLFDLGHPGRKTLIRHAPEHRNHLHVRFYSPVAQRVGRAVHDLVARGVKRAPPMEIPLRCLPATFR